MRILLMPSAYYPSLGGVEEVTSKVAHLLLQKGHSVEVVTNRWPKSLSKFELVEHVRVRRYSFLVPIGLRGTLRFAVFAMYEFAQLLVTTIHFRPDVIHIICCSTNLPYAVLLSRLLRVRLIVSTHGEVGMDAGRLYQSRNFISNNIKRFSEHAAIVTGCSQSTADEFSVYCPGIKCEVLRNGVDLAEFSKEPGADFSEVACQYVFAYGRLVPQKGFSNLLMAWKSVNAPSAKLLIAGDGPDREALVDLAEQLGLKDSVQFLGRLNRAGVAERLRQARAFVLPSLHEPFGLVILEAMASRVPVIATAVGGVPEFVTNGVTGTLVQSGDLGELASAIQKHLDFPADVEQLARAHETACSYDWSNVVSDYMSLYETTVVTKTAQQ